MGEKRLSKITFLAIVVLIGGWMVFGVSNLQTHRTPTELATFRYDNGATEIRYHLREGRVAEKRGRWLMSTAPGEAKSYFSQADDHYRQASRYLDAASRGGFMPQRINQLRRGLSELRRK